jgi:hypothetical protein
VDHRLDLPCCLGLEPKSTEGDLDDKFAKAQAEVRCDIVVVASARKLRIPRAGKASGSDVIRADREGKCSQKMMKVDE